MKLLHPVNNRKSVGFSEMERLEAKLAISNNVAVSMVQVRFMQASYFWNGARFLPLDKPVFSAQFLLSLLKNMPHIPTYDRTNITTLTWNRLNNNELI